MQLFSYTLDIKQFNLKPGYKLDYTFIVTDNDELNGYKSTSSTRGFFEVPQLDELENLMGEKDDALKDQMDQATKDAKELKQEIKDVKSELINKAELDWKDKQSLENLMEMQKELEKQIEEIKEKYDESTDEKDNFLDNSEELKKKQE